MILDADPRVTVDPWLHAEKPEECPDDTTPVCAYELRNALTSEQEGAFYRIHGGQEELWVANLGEGPGISDPRLAPLTAQIGSWSVHDWGCAVARPLGSNPPAGARRLLEWLILSRRGHAWPGAFRASGSIGGEEYREMLTALEDALEENARRAEESRPPIVEVAVELGLGPSPEGSSPSNWLCRCPETNHSLYLAGEEFGCGYCRRSGDGDELRRFTAERRAKK